MLGACGSSESKLDTGRVERAVAASILAQRGLRTTVTCPSDVPLKAGYSFTCNAKLDVGSYPVTVVVTNSKGHVRYENRAPLVALNIEKVEHAIAASIASQRHLHARPSPCPDGGPPEGGDRVHVHRRGHAATPSATRSSSPRSTTTGASATSAS